MRKILTALMVLLSISVLGAVSLSLGEGNIDSVSLYAPDGTLADVSAGIQDSGYLISSKGNGEVFTSPFGDIHLKAESAVAVTDFTLPSPSLYVMEGDVNIVLTEDIELSVYTPTTLTVLPGKGEYAFTTDADTEQFLNMSDHPVTTYDAVTATETEVAPMSGVNRTASQEAFAISAADYYNASVVRDRIIYDEEPAVAEEVPETIVEEPEPVIDRNDFTYGDYTLTVLVGDGYADILYPSIVTEDDAIGFFVYEAAKYGSAIDGITYSFIDGGARLDLPQSISRETANANAEVLFNDIVEYIATLSVPADIEEPEAAEEPAVIEEPEATEAPAVPSAPVVIGPVIQITDLSKEEAAEVEQVSAVPADTFSFMYGGYLLTAAVNDDCVDLFYPSIVTEDDAIGFFAYEVAKYGSAVDGITYSFIEGGVRINLPETISRETAKANIPFLFEDIVEYVEYISAPAVPSAPIATEPETTLIEDVEEAAVIDKYIFNYDGYDLIVSIGDGYADILYPSIVTEDDAIGFFAYEAAKYGSDIDGITYSFIDGGARLNLPQSISRETANANAEVLFNDIVEYIAAMYAPAAEAEGTAIIEGGEGTIISVQEEEPAITAEEPVISGELKDSFSFDIGLLGRAYTDSLGNTSVRAAIQPVFSLGSFRAALNIDPMHIKSAWDESSRDVYGWLGYAFDFIDEIRYRSIDESVILAVDRYSTLSGDTLGLYSGLMHGWDGENQALSFNHEYHSTYYSHRLWFDDLTMTRSYDVNGIEEGWSTAGLSFAFSVSESYPLTFRLEALASISHSDIKDSILYPEVSIDIPFVYTGTSYIGLRAGAATMLSGDYTANPFTENGYLVSVTLPLRFGGFSAEVGAAYSTGNLHYGNAGSSFYSAPAGEYVTIIGKAGYENRWFGIDFRTWFDIDTASVSFVNGNGYADVTAYINLWGVRIFGGFRARDVLAFSDYDKNSGFFAGLSSDAGPVSAYIKAAYMDQAWSLTAGASVSAFGRDKERTEGYSSTLPVGFELETGFTNAYSSAYTPEILVMPVISFGSGLTEAAFRAPIKMAFDDAGSLYLAGMNGRKLWDFGTGSDDNKIYRAITDSFALIDHITLGDGHDTIAYLLAERGYRKNGTLFSDYGWNDALSLRIGFNFPNLAIGIYADNMEAPHISEFSIGFYPIDLDSLSFSINVPMEMLFASSETYELLMYPEFRIDIPFYGFRVSAFIMGEMGTKYRDGIATETNVIYDFQNGTFYDYLIGAELAYSGNGMDISLQTGYRSGRIGPDLFNEFTARNGRIISSMTDISDPGWYIKAAYSLDFGYVDFGISYAIDSIVAMFSDIDNGRYSDTLSISLGGMVSDSARLYGRFARCDFASSFSKGLGFTDYMLSPDTIFALGADFTFGIVGFNAELRTAFHADAEQPYMNILTMNSDPALELSVKARFVF